MIRWKHLPGEKPRKKRTEIPKPGNKAEERFALQLTVAGIRFTREHVFCPPRKWRFDFALVEHKIAIEIEGGLYSGGRHTRAKGYMADMEKYRNAVYLGWKVLRFPPDDIRKGTAILEVAGFLAVHQGIKPT